MTTPGMAAVVLAAAVFLATQGETPGTAPTVEEKVTALRAERASLQARADGDARLGLLSAFRTASLVGYALAIRSDSESDRAFDRLPELRRQAFAEIDALNAALEEALDRPGDGSRARADDSRHPRCPARDRHGDERARDRRRRAASARP